jgi:hypothetical protein
VNEPLRLVVYDATQAERPPRLLGWSWRAGTLLYRARGAIDASFGARSFAEALAWLAHFERPVGELQFWGHGKWGRILIHEESLDRSALGQTHPLRPKLEALRERLAPGALIWFRTCETLGAHAGQDFARALGDFSGARVAGHTFVIGYYQSGLHELAPGATPAWDPGEGLAAGSPTRPERALASGPGLPNTITCLQARLPRALGAASLSQPGQR